MRSCSLRKRRTRLHELPRAVRRRDLHALPSKSRWYDKLPFANTAVDLSYAMVQNPGMRVLVQQGYFDPATPYGVTEYVLNHMDLSPELRRNITVEYYEAGHMMYVHPPSMAEFKRDLAVFIE